MTHVVERVTTLTVVQILGPVLLLRLVLFLLLILAVVSVHGGVEADVRQILLGYHNRLSALSPELDGMHLAAVAAVVSVHGGVEADVCQIHQDDLLLGYHNRLSALSPELDGMHLAAVAEKEEPAIQCYIAKVAIPFFLSGMFLGLTLTGCSETVTRPCSPSPPPPPSRPRSRPSLWRPSTAGGLRAAAPC